MKKVKVAIIDDHAVVRMGLKYALSRFKDLELVAQASDGENAATFLAECGADVLLLDIRMPGVDGITALSGIMDKIPEAKVVMLTTSGTEEDIYRSLSLGARGYVIKDRDPQLIFDAIRAVADGGMYVPDDVMEVYRAHRKEEELTPREREVMQLLAQGCSNPEIAQRLGVSEDGAKMHLRHAYEKMGVKDRAAALAVAARRGIVRMG